jgi:hypothetical protein
MTEEPLQAPRSEQDPTPAWSEQPGPPADELVPAATPAPDIEAALPSHDAAPDPDQSLPPAPMTEGDWLDRICPYLLSEDGTYRSTQPDEGHRCTAQDPPGTLPFAFQERFCLTDRHVRCEMFKFAQSTRSAALEQGGVPADQVKTARFKPSVRSVPLALGPSGGEGDAGTSRRPAILVAAGVGAFLVFIALVVLLSGGGDGETVPGESASPEPGATQAPAATATSEPTTQATAEPQTTTGPRATAEPGATLGPIVDAVTAYQLIRYEVQEGEALLRIAETFETGRNRIIRANEGMADKKPYTLPGDIIIVPASIELSVEELESFSGYLGPAE